MFTKVTVSAQLNELHLFIVLKQRKGEIECVCVCVRERDRRERNVQLLFRMFISSSLSVHKLV